MESPRFALSVRRVTAFERDSTGALLAVTLYRRAGSKKKGSRFLRPLETVVRRLADAQETAAEKYLAEHRRSNHKRRSGWLRDLALNTAKASRSGAKRLKVYRLFGF